MNKRKLKMFLSMTLLTLGLAGCGNSQTPEGPAISNTPAAQKPTQDGVPVLPSAESDPNALPEAEENAILVVFFSCTGTTKSIADRIAEQLSADQYEIVPEQAYTADDLNYNSADSRAEREQNDEQARPAITGKLDSLDSYSTILIGYPLWWGQAPRILSTFLESYDFQGKILIPFCTSASSPIGTSAENLRPLAEDAQWLEGRRFGSTAELSEITEWLETMNLLEQS